MPHRCIECKNVVESGALQLEQGCPICGCKKFQYVRPKKKDKEKEKEQKPTVAEYVASATEAEVAKQEVVDLIKPAVVNAAGEEKKPDRIESVRIHERGRYDINLPILLNRKELVMSKEEGIYIVDLPSALKAKSSRQKKAAAKKLDQETR